jgi:hypothetical protein
MGLCAKSAEVPIPNAKASAGTALIMFVSPAIVFAGFQAFVTGIEENKSFGIGHKSPGGGKGKGSERGRR